jgi:hypothetical protein
MIAVTKTPARSGARSAQGNPRGARESSAFQRPRFARSGPLRSRGGRFLLRHLGIERFEDAREIIGRHYPIEEFPTRALAALEEILGEK